MRRTVPAILLALTTALAVPTPSHADEICAKVNAAGDCIAYDGIAICQGQTILLGTFGDVFVYVCVPWIPAVTS